MNKTFTQAVQGSRFFYPAITVLTIGAVLLAWQNLDLPAYILPKPSVILAKIYSDAASGYILPHILATLTEIAVGFLCAVICGLALGTAVALNRVLAAMIYPFVLTIQTIPKVAIAPLFLIWFGFGINSKIITAGLIALFPILVNVVAGLRSVEPRRMLLMKSLKANRAETFLKVQMPSMLPYFFAGLEVAIVLAVIGAVVAEFVGSSVGLGSLVIQRQSSIDVPGVFSALVYLALLGTSLTLVVRACAARFGFWFRPVRKS